MEIVSKRILIADEKESVLASLAYVLGAKEVEVITCNDFEQAIEVLAATWFDLFITDIGMPGARAIKGLELLAFIKRHFCSEVIVMAGHGWKEIEAETCRVNAIKYLSKPPDIRELLTICEKMDIPVKKHLLV